MPRFGSGLLAQLGGVYSHGVAGDPSEHVAVHADARGVLGFGDHSLSLRLRGDLIERLGDAPIPFEELPSASGIDGVRGLAYGRLRGASVLVATAEYRWLVSPWLDAVLFYDRGNGFRPRFADLSWDNTFSTVGLAFIVVGIRELDYQRRPTNFSFGIALSHDPGLTLSFALEGY
jgi:hypothetical protein